MAAKKKPSKDLTVRSGSEPQPAFIMKNNSTTDIALPSMIDVDAFEKEAVGFTPLIQFGPDADNWKEGNYVIARYIGSRDGIGPNKSAMYDFELPDPEKPGKMIQASLWGSTILDNKMKLLNPQPGKILFIQYLGEVNTSRGMNPAKDFRLAIVKESAAGKL